VVPMAKTKTPVLIKGRARELYRRDHWKADGRLLSLYGYQPHSGTPGDELLRDTAETSEIRYDPLRQSWAIYAPHRQSRTFQPGASSDPLAPASAGRGATEIPFEAFEVAIFENKFSSLTSAAVASELSPWASKPATGRCEVVVYSSEDEGNLTSIGQDRRLLLLEALCDRYRDLYASGAAYVLAFENRGQQVGVTLPHPHGQIYAFDQLPEPQARAQSAFSQGYDLIEAHRNWGGAFDIAADGNWVAFAPPFSRFPYETWLMPRTSCPGPWALDQEGLEALARMLGEIPRRLDSLFGQPMPYMMSFQVAPQIDDENFQFTVQFYPVLRDTDRLKYLASVEQFTGVFTVDVVPELAARKLRSL